MHSVLQGIVYSLS